MVLGRRKYGKDDRCKKCRHLKETVRVKQDIRLRGCTCTGPCGCFTCLECNTIPCACETMIKNNMKLIKGKPIHHGKDIVGKVIEAKIVDGNLQITGQLFNGQMLTNIALDLAISNEQLEK